MTTSDRRCIGVVEALWRFPVKSMLGERLGSTAVSPAGVVGDRAYVLADAATGTVVTAKTPELGPKLLHCRAAFAEPPLAGAEPPPIVVTLPDGSRISSADPDAPRRLGRFFGRPLTFRREAPSDSTIVHARTVLSARAGLDLAVPPGSLLDVMPVSFITTSTLASLAAARPQTHFDERRFRMNLTVRTTLPGFSEQHWVERNLAVGEDVRLRSTIPVPRCVVPTMAQPGLPRDADVLRTVAEQNSLRIGGRPYPCAGGYATVVEPGVLTVGDYVHLVD